jgi:hypothetical protein
MIALIASAVFLVAQPAPAGYNRIPLEIIQGEAGNCPIEARYAVARLWHDNPKMYGWDEDVDKATREVWLTYQQTKNPHPEARFIFGSGDLGDRRVQSIIRELNRPPRAIFQCSGGALFLY